MDKIVEENVIQIVTDNDRSLVDGEKIICLGLPAQHLALI